MIRDQAWMQEIERYLFTYIYRGECCLENTGKKAFYGRKQVDFWRFQLKNKVMTYWFLHGDFLFPL